MTTTRHTEIPTSLRAAFHETLDGLADPDTLLGGQHLKRLLSQVDILTESPEGMALLLDEMPRMVEADIFRATTWEHPDRLVPTLASGTLRAGGEMTLFEILSELRLLAIAQGRLEDPRFSRARAREFLEQMLVNDLARAYPRAPRAPRAAEDARELEEPAAAEVPGALEAEGHAAEAQGAGGADGAGAATVADPLKLRHLFQMLTREFPIDAMKEVIAAEIELICAQRPIVTDRVQGMVRVLAGRTELDSGREEDRRLLFYMNAVLAPSEAAEHRTLEEYAAFLGEASPGALEKECRELSRTMRETGLAVGAHALLLRRVAKESRLLALALGVDAGGRTELLKHRDFVTELVLEAIHPATARSCYGLSLLLDRGLLSQQPVKSRLERFSTMELHPEVAALLREREAVARQREAPDGEAPAEGAEPAHARWEREGAARPRALLLADCLGVLGQPLGVGQGGNPTCQSARGISLWSRHAPGKLLGMIETAATTNDLTMRFEGETIQASEVAHDVAGEFDRNLDAVSLVLVPHLDRIYNEMMRRASYRGEDPHKWVNPAMYGHWIPHGFTSAYDYLTDSIRGYESFLRTFYATHHPDYNGGHDLAYPNPVGIFLTTSSGALIGFHAVSILRVRAKSGQVRVYFVNPNNEGRQHWQAEIRPTVAGNGESPGESSLPFHQFASRLYAFHFSPGEVGDPGRVDPGELERVTAISRESWGLSYRWTEEPTM